MKKIAVLGSSGSIGTQTLDVVRAHPELFEVCALTVHTDLSALTSQAGEFRPAFLGATGLETAGKIDGVPVECGAEALLAAVEGADLVVLAVVGIAGLPAFEKCLREGIPVALANKEAMVCGGQAARDLMDETKTPVYPVDSELSAIFQCLNGSRKEDIKTIWLTASGGPFFDWTAERIAAATPAQALKHPNWDMGAKVTIDSASLANKGLEMMETRWLFGVAPETIEVAVHRKSIVHSMVEYRDGGMMAQLGVPDMRIPIQYALTYPARFPSPAKRLDLFSMGGLEFFRPDPEKFPCLGLAKSAMHKTQLQVAFNAANEIAVARFLKEEIGFSGIPKTIERAMGRFISEEIHTFSDIYELDRAVREFL